MGYYMVLTIGYYRETFDKCVSRMHFISKADINNVRVKVQGNLIRRHKDDATSVSLLVSELKSSVVFF